MSIQRGVSRTFPFGSLTLGGTANTTVTPTVAISRDGAAQAATTNPAVHNGGGQWLVTLTAAEMTADTIGLVATGASLVPAYLTITTEADYTVPRAARLDDLDGPVSGIPASLLNLADGIEPGETPLQFFRQVRAVLLGVSDNNGGAGPVAFKRKDGATVSLTVTYTNQSSRTLVVGGTN